MMQHIRESKKIPGIFLYKIKVTPVNQKSPSMQSPSSLTQWFQWSYHLLKSVWYSAFKNVSHLCQTLDYLCSFQKLFRFWTLFSLERGQRRRHYLLSPGKKMGEENNEQAWQCCDEIFTNMTSILKASSIQSHFLDIPEHPNKTPVSLTACYYESSQM